MNGTLADKTIGEIAFANGAEPFGGGIQTQYVGPQPGRAWIRANQVSAINEAAGACHNSGDCMGCAIMESPTRLSEQFYDLCAHQPLLVH